MGLSMLTGIRIYVGECVLTSLREQAAFHPMPQRELGKRKDRVMVIFFTSGQLPLKYFLRHGERESQTPLPNTRPFLILLLRKTSFGIHFQVRVWGSFLWVKIYVQEWTLISLGTWNCFCLLSVSHILQIGEVTTWQGPLNKFSWLDLDFEVLELKKVLFRPWSFFCSPWFPFHQWSLNRKMLAT